VREHYGLVIRKSFSMTQAEKQVLSDIAIVLENLIVRADALEGALIGKALIPDGLVGQMEGLYRQTAINDLASLRVSISSLPITGNVRG
jgi:hypothetical protein